MQSFPTHVDSDERQRGDRPRRKCSSARYSDISLHSLAKSVIPPYLGLEVIWPPVEIKKCICTVTCLALLARSAARFPDRLRLSPCTKQRPHCWPFLPSCLQSRAHMLRFICRAVILGQKVTSDVTPSQGVVASAEPHEVPLVFWQGVIAGSRGYSWAELYIRLHSVANFSHRASYERFGEKEEYWQLGTN